jgi:hypothetical protein
MTEYRRAKRKQANDVIDVLDTMTERVIGRIGNISESGMLMIGSDALFDDALFQLRFSLPGRGTGREISVGAHHLWSDQANMPGQVWSGFRFIDLANEDIAALRAWIDQPGSNYV